MHVWRNKCLTVLNTVESVLDFREAPADTSSRPDSPRDKFGTRCLSDPCCSSVVMNVRRAHPLSVQLCMRTLLNCWTTSSRLHVDNVK